MVITHSLYTLRLEHKTFSALIVITYFCSTLAYAQTYTNTNDQQNGKTFGQLMTWVLDGEKGLKRVEIETSNEWQSLSTDQTNYAVWIGHATYLINNGDINILTDPIFLSSITFWISGQKNDSASDDPKSLPRIDVVVVSHNHYDHFDIFLKKIIQA